MKNEEICSRFQRVKGDRYVVEDIWDAIELYIAPYRGRFFKDEKSENSIQWRRPFVFDGTAIMASQNLASSLHSRLTSASTKWFGMKFKEDNLNDDIEALAWLEDVTNVMFDAMQESNFNVQINEVYQDLVNFGTGFMLEEEVDVADLSETSPITFTSVMVKEAYFEQNSKGGILNFYQKKQWTARQITDYFKDKVPKFISDAASDPASDPNTKWDIIYCIFRRAEVQLDPYAKDVAPEKRAFGFKFVLLDSGEPLGEEGGYYEMPCFVPRWRKTSSSMWGNSPAMIALADTLTLNRTIELNLQAVEKQLDPPILTTSRGLIGDLDLTAGGLSVVRDVKEVVPFQSGARFDVTYQEMNRLRENIEGYFFIPQLILPPMQGTPATATEIAVRMQQLEALIGPTLGRLQVDLLDPIIKRTFGILFRAGKLPEMPQIIAENEGRIEIEYLSPIAKTQEASNVQAIERFAMSVMNLGQGKPEVLDIPDWDAMVKSLASMLGVSAKLIRPDAEVAAERQQRQAIQAQAAQGEAMKMQGEGMQAMQEAGQGGAV